MGCEKMGKVQIGNAGGKRRKIPVLTGSPSIPDHCFALFLLMTRLNPCQDAETNDGMTSMGWGTSSVTLPKRFVSCFQYRKMDGYASQKKEKHVELA